MVTLVKHPYRISKANNIHLRHRDDPLKTPYMWDSDRDTPPSLTTKCLPRSSSCAHARRSRASRQYRCVVDQAFQSKATCRFVDSFGLGAAVFIDDPLAYEQPTIAQLQKWSAEQEESMKTQLAYTETKTAKEGSNPSRAMSEEALRKRKEREERKKAQAAAKDMAEGVEGSSSSLNLAESEGANTPTEPSTSTSEGPKNSSLPYTIVIPASSSSLDWYDPTECTYSTIESARLAGVWDYPSTLSERARCGVFKDLWKQGYFMGGGIKFGGEYLVYPGVYRCTLNKQIPSLLTATFQQVIHCVITLTLRRVSSNLP